MRVRDHLTIIVQHSKSDPTYLDGGDSARVAGLMAMTGSEIDKNNLSKFVLLEGLGVRHPAQQFHNNPNNFTRDQLLCLMAGMSLPSNRALFKSHAKRLFFCQNSHDQDDNKKPWWSRDILHPGNIGYMIQAAKIVWLYPLLPICWIFLFLDIVFGVFIKPWRESNQLIAMLTISGTFWLKLYCKLHPDWKKPIEEYWSGWRDQKEIGDNIINFITNKITSD